MNKVKKYKLKLDYTVEELKELKRLRERCFSPMLAVWLVVDSGNVDDTFRNLRKKYIMLDNHKDFDFMADVNNVVMGTVIFPKKEYVVHDKVTDRYIYFNRIEKSFYWSQLKSWIPEIKTKDEWLAINPAYELRLEKVED